MEFPLVFMLQNTGCPIGRISWGRREEHVVVPTGSLWESCFPIWNLSWTTNPNTSTERRQWGRSHAATKYCCWLHAAPNALLGHGKKITSMSPTAEAPFILHWRGGCSSISTHPALLWVCGVPRHTQPRGRRESATEPRSTGSALSSDTCLITAKKGQPNSYHQALWRFDILGIVS